MEKATIDPRPEIGHLKHDQMNFLLDTGTGVRFIDLITDRKMLAMTNPSDLQVWLYLRTPLTENSFVEKRTPLRMATAADVDALVLMNSLHLNEMDWITYNKKV